MAKRWQTATAILFAAGALSGTILAFELGMFWPEFMRRAGPIVAVPFSMESFAFFIEAIFLALYTYGWRKLPPWFHFKVAALSYFQAGARPHLLLRSMAG